MGGTHERAEELDLLLACLPSFPASCLVVFFIVYILSVYRTGRTGLACLTALSRNLKSET